MAWNHIEKNMYRVGGSFNEITIDTLEGHEDGLRLVDVREKDEFVGPLGAYPGSELVPMGTLPQEVGSWDTAEPVVLICRSGGRSGRMAAFLEAKGFEKIVSLGGGMIAYNEKFGRPE